MSESSELDDPRLSKHHTTRAASDIDQPERLQDRYGNTKTARRRGLVFAVSTAIVFVLAFALWVIWAGLDGTSDVFRAQDTAHTVIDEHSVEVRYDISAPPGTELTCALQALNGKFAIVGWKVVDIPASDALTRSFSDTIRTSELASTGLIYRCWLP